MTQEWRSILLMWFDWIIIVISYTSCCYNNIICYHNTFIIWKQTYHPWKVRIATGSSRDVRKNREICSNKRACHNRSHCAHHFAPCENFTDTALLSRIFASVAKVFSTLLSSRSSRQMYVRVLYHVLHSTPLRHRRGASLHLARRTASTQVCSIRLSRAHMYSRWWKLIPFLQEASNFRIRGLKGAHSAFCFSLTFPRFIHQQLRGISLPSTSRSAQ